MRTESSDHAAVAGNPGFADWVFGTCIESGYPEATGEPGGFCLCASGNDCSADKGLALTVARFRRGARDLEDSATVFFIMAAHPRFDDVVITISAVTTGACRIMRNAPAEFANMSLSSDDVAALVAFLQSLTAE